MGRPRHVEWLDDYEAASAWMSQYNIKKLLKKGKGLAKVSNFLPEFVAKGILADLEKIPAQNWNKTEATDDLAYNNISHSFLSVKKAKGLDRALRVITLLQPESLNSFSAAKYTGRDHIAPHDDRAYTQVLMEDGQVITTSRTVAVIVYFTQDWTESDGGLLVDLEDSSGQPKAYVPEFNSAIIFSIPRWHQVTEMKTSRPRYTLFGWFLAPGKLYDLNLGNEQPPTHATQHPTSPPALPSSETQRAGTSHDADKPAATTEPSNEAHKRKKKRRKGNAEAHGDEAQGTAEPGSRQGTHAGGADASENGEQGRPHVSTQAGARGGAQHTGAGQRAKKSKGAAQPVAQNGAQVAQEQTKRKKKKKPGRSHAATAAQL